MSMAQKYGWLERLQIPAALHQAIKEEAKRENRRISEQVKYILTRWYEGKQK